MVKVCKYSEELGRSMIEILAVLAIVGVLSIAGIVGYTKAMAKYKIDATLDQVTMLIANIRATFGHQSSYEKLSNETAIKYKLVENDLSHGATSGSTLTNTYNKPVILLPATRNVANDSFTVEYQGLPASACSIIAIANWGGSAASGLHSIKVQETEFTWTGENKFPITLVEAEAACNDPNNNTIIWTYF